MKYTWNPVVSTICVVYLFCLTILHSITLLLLKQVFNSLVATSLTLFIIIVSWLVGIERKKTSRK